MKRYLHYCGQLDRFLEDISWGANASDAKDAIESALNGGASAALRRVVSANRLKRFGAFFTGEKLGRRTLAPLVKDKLLLGKKVCDPTCGTGDLLLRWAENLPIERDLSATLEQWGTLVHGLDLHEEFIRVARRRLTLLAISKGARVRTRSKPDLEQFLPGLRVGDIFGDNPMPLDHATLVMNPPFTYSNVLRNCEWSSGRVSNAAIAFLGCLQRLNVGEHIAAILPEVLRSGHRYAKWRLLISRMLSGASVDLFGRFDDHADIDVFVVRGVKVSAGGAVDWKTNEALPGSSLSSICNVRVGAVVPHRDPHMGKWRPFVTVHDLPPWGELRKPQKRRRFLGSTVTPPFVAVRRTSSPSDNERAVGTIVRGRESAALENHVIALKPTDRSIETCERILAALRDKRTRVWLDKRIRCRHLTVGAVRDIPLWPSSK